jgi:hypothetical protein
VLFQYKGPAPPSPKSGRNTAPMCAMAPWSARGPQEFLFAPESGTDLPIVRRGTGNASASHVTHIAMLPGSFEEVLQHPLIGLRERTYEALDRLEHDSPLRFGLKDAERAESQLRPWRNPHAELWVVPHPLTRTEAGGRSSAAGASSRTSASHVLRDGGVGPIAGFVLPRISPYNFGQWSGSASHGRG